MKNLNKIKVEKLTLISNIKVYLLFDFIAYKHI